jgi:hypothetical protein
MIYQLLRDASVKDEMVSRGLHHTIRALRGKWIDGEIGAALRMLRDSTVDTDAELEWADAEWEPPLWIPYVRYGG